MLVPVAMCPMTKNPQRQSPGARSPEAARASRRQGSELPRRHGRRETEVVAAAVTPAAADTEPVGTEVADVDAVTVRVLVLTTDPIGRKQSLTGCEEVDGHSHHD